MHFIPIAERELRVAARRPATYYARIYTCAPMILIMAYMMLANFGIRRGPRQLGASLFETLCWISFAGAIFAGMGALADCISREKREGTLGLLFLTDLTGFDVVMGKLAANSLSAVYNLLAIVPLFAITILLGGVTFWEVARVALALFNAVFFSLAASLLASTLCWDARRAASLAFLILLSFVVLIPAGTFGIGYYLKSQGVLVREEWGVIVMLINPGFAFFQVSNWFSGVTAWLFWGSLIIPHLIAWSFLWLAGRILPRTWQDRPATATRLRWRERIRNWLQGDAVARKNYRQRLLDLNSVTWLACRDRLKPVYPWCFLAIGLAVWTLGLVLVGKDWLSFPCAVTAIILLHLVLRLWIGSESAQCFGENLRSGALELVLSTSLTVDEIVRGQLLALRRQFLRPAITVLLADVILVGLALVFDDSTRGKDVYFFFLMVGAGMAMFAADMYVIGWVGMWQGLTAKDLRKAASGASARVLFLPWAIYLICFTAAGLLGIRVPGNSDAVAGWLLWFVTGMAVDFYYFSTCRRKLWTEFRAVAMRRYSSETKRTFWQRLGLSAE